MTGPTVIVTRPPQQADSLCKTLTRAGAQVIRLPVIDIAGISLPRKPDLQGCEWLIFTSPNAVHHGLDQLPALPAHCHVAAVGAATARALNEAGIKDVLIPEADYSSEGLLALPPLQTISGQRIALVKGQGGRALIADSLRNYGAEVQELVVYQRCLLSPPTQQVTDALAQASQAIVTSGEILQRLYELTPAIQKKNLLALQLVVPSARVVQMAQSMGFLKVCLVPSPLTEQALVEAVLDAHSQALVPGQSL